jgi:nanoRNase/pAp phosphatase (c-di-AMP/oligoRNAs hydrolase)
MNNTPQEIWQAIISAKNPILTIDSRFDFDAFGSALALREAMQRLGLKLRLTYTDVIPERALEFISIDGIEQELEPSKIDFSQHDLLITIDSQDYIRTSKRGEFTPPENITKVKIDHHGEQIYNADFHYLRPASSSCRLMWEIFKANGVVIDQKIAELLAVGLLTDSGFLQYESVDSEDFRMMADLIDSGLDSAGLYWKFTSNVSVDNLKFIQLIYSNMVIDFENKWAYSFYMHDDIKNAGINKEMVFSNGADLLKRLKGVDFTFVVKQSDSNPKDYNASFRSRLPEVDVSIFAKGFEGGGGHKMAASGTVTGVADIQEAIKKTIEVINANREAAYKDVKSA